MKKNLVKAGQVWKSKTGKYLLVVRKATGNFHWTVKDPNKKRSSHHIHEGTLQKYYELLLKNHERT